MKSLVKTKAGILMSLLFILPMFMLGQSGVEGTLTLVRDWLIGIGNVVFVIVIIIGLFPYHYRFRIRQSQCGFAFSFS